MPLAALSALSPDDWLRTELAPHLGAPAPTGASPDWCGLDDLDRARLAALHALHVAGGATGAAAAKWLVGWFAGWVGAAVGRTLALTGAALAVDPARVRWRVHPDGWPDGLDLGRPPVHVAAGHPWAGSPGVTVLPSQGEVRDVALTSAVDVGRPLVERFRGLAKAGPPALWAEVGDRFGLALALDPGVPVDQHAVDELRAAVATPAAPWRVVPALEIGPTACGPAYVGQKGGCCLAYQSSPAEQVAGPPGSWQEVLRARFPERTAYCSSCSLLDAKECRARQRLWIEHHRSPPTGNLG